jgi:hypothetical protein
MTAEETAGRNDNTVRMNYGVRWLQEWMAAEGRTSMNDGRKTYRKATRNNDIGRPKAWMTAKKGYKIEWREWDNRNEWRRKRQQELMRAEKTTRMNECGRWQEWMTEENTEKSTGMAEWMTARMIYGRNEWRQEWMTPGMNYTRKDDRNEWQTYEVQ